MTSCSQARALAEGAVEVHELADLGEVLDPQVHLASWTRPVDDRISDLARRTAEHLGRDSRVILRYGVDSLRGEVAALIPEEAWAHDAAAAEAWRDDVVRHCEAFAELLQAEDLMVSFEGPEERTCPRFHVDRVGVRMLVTYSGPGTEWLADADVDRARLGEAGQDLPDDQNGVMRPGAVIRSVAPFAVALLKGEAWPGAEGFGAVHRSPDPGGAPRALLRVDMLSQQKPRD